LWYWNSRTIGFINALKENAEMPYCLPPLNQTYVEHSGNDTILMWRKNDGETGWISTFTQRLDHKTAHAKHTAAVKKYRRIQRLWKFGGKFFFRERLLAAFYS
jgi:hypothetical protein